MSSPVFDPERFGRVFSLPFKIPLTPQNQRAMQFSHRFDAQTPPRFTDVVLFAGGAQYDTGELLPLGSNSKQLDVMFRNLPITIVEELSNVNMSDIMETIEIPVGAITAQVTLSVTAPPDDYALVIGGNIYQLSAAGSAGFGKPDVVLYFRDAINADFPGMASMPAGDELVLESELLDLHPPTWNLMENFAFVSYYTNGRVSQINFLQYVQDCCTTPVATHAFPMVKWFDFYGNKNGVYGGSTRHQGSNLVNKTFNNTGSENAETTEEKNFRHTYVPFLRMSYLLHQIGLLFPSGYSSDFDFSEILVANNKSCDYSYRNWVETDQFLYLNGHVETIALSEHAPPMTVMEFLRLVARSFNLIFEYKSGGLFFRKILDILEPPPADWSKMVDIAVYNHKISGTKGVTVQYLKTKETLTNNGQLDNYVVGAGGIKTTLPFSIFQMEEATIDDHGDNRIPHTRQMGKSAIFGDSSTDLPPYFLFDRGVGVNTLAEDYIYATVDELDSDGTTVVGSLSMVLDGDYGIIRQNFGGTILIPDSPELDIKVILPIKEVYRLQKWENGRIQFYHPSGNVTAYLKTVDVDIPIDGGEFMPGRATMTLIR